jgi:putative DNA primase/helicase
MDRDPFLLNVFNGTLDLRTGKLRPHRREDLLTKLAPAEFKPNATCPLWLPSTTSWTASNGS